MYLHFTEISTSSLTGVNFTLSRHSIHTFCCLIFASEGLALLIDCLLKITTNPSWKSSATWVVPQLLYLVTLCAENEGESGVKLLLLHPEEYHQECMSAKGWYYHFPLDTTDLKESTRRMVFALWKEIKHRL